VNTQKPNASLKHTVITLLIVMVIVVLLDIIQFSLEEEPVVIRRPPTPWEQCMIWNKWSDWPKVGQCPGDLQPRWFR
jgi:hypothetical protein